MENTISAFLQKRIDAGDFPSAVYLVAEKGEIVFHGALGYAVVEPERIESRTDTIYDLASLTKPLVTGLLFAKLLQNDEIKLNETVSEFLPEFKDDAHRSIKVLELATHTSRIRAWIPLYLTSSSLLRVSETIGSLPLDIEAAQVLYSDLNFISLANVIEAARLGRQLDLLAAEELFEPLSLKRTVFNPKMKNWFRLEEAGGRRSIAASENGNGYERQVCIENGYLSNYDVKSPVATTSGSDLFFRDYQIWGEVHDGNAWFMGGVAGHAGLFSTAEETFKIALQSLPNYTTLLKPETCALFRTNFTKGMNEHRSVAFQLASSPDSTAGSKMSPESFGHLGFTGTSLWIDPVKERIFILLTNRTHAHALPFVNINSVRRTFHDLANDLLDKHSN